jgi:hypothetical protein
MQPITSPPTPLFALFGKTWPRRAARPERRPADAAAPAVAGRHFLHVRSVRADGRQHLFQFALVDDFGNVTASVFASRASPVFGGSDPEAMVPDPPTVLWDRLHDILKPCVGAELVVFGQALQGALLPYGVRQDLGRMECARGRFMRVARRRGMRVRPGEVLDLNDARALAGLPIVRSCDAALRALGLRELWRWMDEG